MTRWRSILILGASLCLTSGCAAYGTHKGEADSGESDNGGFNNGDDIGEENIANNCEDCPRLWAPVCGVDFVNYDNACFADCLGPGWWHQGECLEGEGDPCYRLCGTPDQCEEGLACFGGSDCEAPMMPGACVLAGSCLGDEYCRNRNLPHDDCDGDWTCLDHVCAWECD